MEPSHRSPASRSRWGTPASSAGRLEWGFARTGASDLQLARLEIHAAQQGFFGSFGGGSVEISAFVPIRLWGPGVEIAGVDP